MKQLITKIKNLWKIFLKIIFKRWIPEQQSAKEVSIGLFNWICRNRPTYFDFHCHICGNILTYKNIDEKHFTKDYVALIYNCKKCQFNIQKRYDYEMKEISYHQD
jgi:hypothetical protein